MTGTRLVRSGKGGATIHRATCPRVPADNTPWVWAEGRKDSDWFVKEWLHPCRVCLPELAERQDRLRLASTTTTATAVVSEKSPR